MEETKYTLKEEEEQERPSSKPVNANSVRSGSSGSQKSIALGVINGDAASDLEDEAREAKEEARQAAEEAAEKAEEEAKEGVKEIVDETKREVVDEVEVAVDAKEVEELRNARVREEKVKEAAEDGLDEAERQIREVEQQLDSPEDSVLKGVGETKYLRKKEEEENKHAFDAVDALIAGKSANSDNNMPPSDDNERGEEEEEVAEPPKSGEGSRQASAKSRQSEKEVEDEGGSRRVSNATFEEESKSVSKVGTARGSRAASNTSAQENGLDHEGSKHSSKPTTGKSGDDEEEKHDQEGEDHEEEDDAKEDHEEDPEPASEPLSGPPTAPSSFAVRPPHSGLVYKKGLKSWWLFFCHGWMEGSKNLPRSLQCARRSRTTCATCDPPSTPPTWPTPITRRVTREPYLERGGESGHCLVPPCSLNLGIYHLGLLLAFFFAPFYPISLPLSLSPFY